MQTQLLRLVIALLLGSVSSLANADAVVLANKGPVAVTTEDFYTHHFMNSPAKTQALRESDREVDSTITEVATARLFARSNAAHLKLSAEEQKYQDMLVERTPLSAQLNIAERRARAKFSAKDPLVIARAREIWLTDQKSFLTDESADITQIFFDLALRPFKETTSRVEAAQAELKAGKPFEEVLVKYSDDKGLERTKGRILNVLITRADPLMGKTIFKTLQIGEVSDAVPSRIGLHIVRLDAKRAPQKKSFDDVKGGIFDQLMEETARNARIDLINEINKVPTVLDAKGVDSFRAKGDPEFEEKRRKLYQDMGIPVSPRPSATPQ